MDNSVNFIVRHWRGNEVVMVKRPALSMSQLNGFLSKELLNKTYELGDWLEVIALSPTSPSGHAVMSASTSKETGEMETSPWSDFEPDDFLGSPVKV